MAILYRLKLEKSGMPSAANVIFVRERPSIT
jgi:hypothetical protein